MEYLRVNWIWVGTFFLILAGYNLLRMRQLQPAVPKTDKTRRRERPVGDDVKIGDDNKAIPVVPMVSRNETVHMGTVAKAAETTHGVLALEGIHKGAFIPIEAGGSVLIGQRPWCSLVYPETMQDIGGVHCRIGYCRADGKYELEDLHSGKPLTVSNGTAVTAGKILRLSEGDEFCVGDGQRFRLLGVIR